MLRLLLLGTPEISVPVFESLLNDKRFQVCALVCQPDREVGRKQIKTSPASKTLAEKYNILVLQPETPKDEIFLETVKSLSPDIAFVFAYGHILRQEFLDIPKYGCVNLHTSILPIFRGASPVQSAILHGLKETGITYILMDRGMDTGPILKAYNGIPLSDKNISEVHKMITKKAAETVGDVLFEYTEEIIIPETQDSRKATYCRQLRKEDGHISAKVLPAGLIMASFRAFVEWPGIYSFWRGERIQWLKLENTYLISQQPGNFSFDENHLYIDSLDYKIRVLQIRREGKNIQTGKEFLQAFRKELTLNPSLL